MPEIKVDLSGKTAIVTGGSRGIGKAIALALSQAGANVVIAARTEEESATRVGTIHKTAEEIKRLGGNALPIRCDVTMADEVQKMVEKALSAYGAIDILVNDAGFLHMGRFMETDIKDFNRIWQVNVFGPFLCTRAVLAHMMPRKSGSIVNISSGLAESTQAENNIYSASKAALNRMMLNLAAEVAEYNIAVNLLCPGFTRLERPPGRIPPGVDHGSLPSVVAPPAVWLAAQNASSFTGKIVEADSFGSAWP
ncbi:MAG: SDR family oxidoreductase [Chloroflexi bacterium]|nr:SDR family oxidoreductase [Chloroflexota bacterium]